jgi:leucyl aminopeptidase
VVKFSAFRNRYYTSKYGKESSEWLLQQVKSVIAESGAKNVTASSFPHPWKQSSIIATIPGRSNKTIVISAHLDSINLVSTSIPLFPFKSVSRAISNPNVPLENATTD